MKDRDVALVSAFFEALSRGDLDAMAACYHPEVSFADPIFPEVEGRDRVMAMWTSQLRGRGEFKAGFHEVTGDDRTATARWTAHYTYRGTGRVVDSEIESFFRFEDGLIVGHRDEFDFRRWSRRALGRPVGFVLGWMPGFRKTIRDRARQALEEVAWHG
ncbi:nuclear transport factor 2 family protein [Thermoactinospora rubra]|uniref:nuclear transport factor 2 family protein n=1 Tax=Thermoactinospora rubra TaxID=1088767 RepID=UPI000A102AB6|nr:nuclear transport factor 2 family protein [Thermoactinospora rubra]